MGMFLNSGVFFDKFKKLCGGTYFVDKSALLGELFPFIGDENCYFCITHPRRFGKTVVANMAASFFAGRWTAESCSTIWRFPGMPVPARIQEYAASAMELSTRDQIYSAMVVLGLLAYNHEAELAAGER